MFLISSSLSLGDFLCVVAFLLCVCVCVCGIESVVKKTIEKMCEDIRA